jgi:hypothetical protein
MTPLTTPWPLRFLNWSAGDWAGRGVGALLLWNAALLLGVGWLLAFEVYPWMSEGRGWIAGAGLYLAAAGSLLAALAARAAWLGAQPRGERLALCVAAALAAAPSLWAPWNLSGEHWSIGDFYWPIDPTGINWVVLAAFLWLPPLAVALTALRAALPHAGPVSEGSPRGSLRVAGLSAMVLVVGGWFAVPLSIPRNDEHRDPLVDFALLRAPWRTRLHRVDFLDLSNTCPCDLSIWALLPPATSDACDRGCPAWGVWPGERILRDDWEITPAREDALFAALVDPAHPANDRLEIIGLLPDHPELGSRAIPVLFGLMRSPEVGPAGIAEWCAETDAEAAEYLREARQDLRDAALIAVHEILDPEHPMPAGVSPAEYEIADVRARASRVRRELPKELAVPGVGINGLVIGFSTPQDVFDTYGRDAKVSRSQWGDRAIYRIGYRGGRNEAAPAAFSFSRGRLTLGNESTRDQVERVFGTFHEPYGGGDAPVLRYPLLGIQFDLGTRDRVQGFTLFAPR